MIYVCVACLKKLLYFEEEKCEFNENFRTSNMLSFNTNTRKSL